MSDKFEQISIKPGFMMYNGGLLLALFLKKIMNLKLL